MDWRALGQDATVGFCEHDNEPSSSLEWRFSWPSQ